MSMPLRSGLLVLALVSVPEAGAQLHEGPMMGPPAAFAVDDATFSTSGPVAADLMQRKRAGFVGHFPVVSTAGTVEPDWVSLPFLSSAFRVNAFSIGQDVVSATVPVGGISMVSLPGVWGAMVYSVRRDTAGEPGSVVQQQLLAPDGNGADLFSYVLPGSSFPASIAPCYPTDTSQLAQDSPTMNLFDGVNQGEVSFLDLYLPYYMAGSPTRDLVPNQPTVYFSVRHEDVFPTVGLSPVPSAWFDDGSGPSAATILKTRWTVTAGTGSWSTPRVHLNFNHLELDEQDDIDALALDEGRCLALFSIVSTGAGLGEQLQVVSWPCAPDGAWSMGGTDVGEYTNPDTGDPVGRSADIASDGDLDALCTIDPEDENAGSCAPAYGWPSGRTAFNKQLSAQIHRDDSNPGPTATLVIDGVSPLHIGKFLQVWVLISGLPPIKAYEELIVVGAGPPHRTISFTHPALGGPPGGPSICVDFAPVIVPSPKVGAPMLSLRLF